MHDLKWIEQNVEQAKKMFAIRGVNNIDDLVLLIKKRKEQIKSLEDTQQKRNSLNENLKNADKSLIESSRLQMKELSINIKNYEQLLQNTESELEDILLKLPNFALPCVPLGESDADNVVVKNVLDKPLFNFMPKDHLELGLITDTIDMQRAAKISGTRFAFLKSHASKLNRALIQFFCDYHIEKGDIELTPPYLVKENAMIGTGQFPKFQEDAFKVIKYPDEEYFLIPTAEVPVTNYYADEILSEEELPLRFCAYSACFRAEAGAAGRDTKGMIRLHQFEKVEMVRFVHPQDALSELDLMVQRASHLLTLLELPHRVIELCSGDLGFGSEKTFDLEVFLPSQNTYREISSCSSFGSFQARRAKIRYKNKTSKPQHVVTLNGSGLPLGRTIVALYENHQQEDGSVKIPEVLQKYMNGLKVIPVIK